MEVLVAIDALDDALHHAKLVPLTDQARIDSDELAGLVERLRAAWPPRAPGALLDELDALVADAKPVPLTSQARVDRQGLHDVLDRMRAELPEAIRRDRGGAPAPQGLQHVALEVREADADGEVRFWRLLGFAEVDPPQTLRGRTRWLERAGTQVHLLLTGEPVAPPSGHAAVVAEDYATVVDRLRRTGFEPDPRQEHWGAPRSFVRSPAGHRVEVMARAPGAGA